VTAGTFNRDRLPDWVVYADQLGLTLQGRGRWRNVTCDFHDDGEPSMRVNVESGGWVCMACGAKGGDVLAHYMQRTGMGFVQAAQDLGAWVAGGNGEHAPEAPRRLSARDALGAVGIELGVCAVVISDARRGIVPNDGDWRRFLEAAGRVQFIATEAAT
jgi:hypothetical protein